MITIRQFVGSLLSELARARVISDASSAHIAQRYLDHDILKTFPVPRMHLKDVEVDLCFAVAAAVETVDPMQDEDVRRNISARLDSFLKDLPDTPQMKPHFDADGALAAKWTAGLPGLQSRLAAALPKLPAQRSGQVAKLAVMIENYVHDVLNAHENLLSRVVGLFQARPEQSGPLDSYIRDRVRELLGGVDAPGTEASVIDDLMDLQVLIGADDLQRLDVSRLQKVKLTFTSADRKWMATESGGQTTHVLTP